MSAKMCSRCKVSKDSGEFYVSKANKDGLQPYCKSCIRAYKRDHTAQVQAEVLARVEAWQKELAKVKANKGQNSPEYFEVLNHRPSELPSRTKYFREWREKNRERYTAYQREYYRKSKNLGG